MSVLLLGADYYGTLAAARCYGRNGLRVAFADESRLARGLYSRYVDERLVHPPISQPLQLIDWLVAYGERHPGTLLYPPNDHLAWLFAAEGERLGKVFSTFAPAEEALIALLDKKRLNEACAGVGLEVPETHHFDAHRPGSGKAPPALPGRLNWPVLIKPRTQVLLDGGLKGLIAADQPALVAGLARFHELVRFHPALTSRYPDIVQPMVQQYLPIAETGILSISGFAGRSGDLELRAAQKVLQRPRKVGIGLCFETREVEAPLAGKLAALCRRVGYYGAFEAEFIADGERRLLIDFNPRFYSQMGFELARGLPLPMLVWHAARGEGAKLDEALARARAWVPSGREAYCHETMLELLLVLQGLSGAMPRKEVRRWRGWLAGHRGQVTDAIRDSADRLPALVDGAQWLRQFALHPRSFLRSFLLNR